MKRQFTLAAALALVGGLAFAAPGPANAAPVNAAAIAAPAVSKGEPGQATAVHYRRGYSFHFRGGRNFGGHVYINPRRYHRGYRYQRRYYHAPRYHGRRYYNNHYYGRRHHRGHGYHYQPYGYQGGR